MDDYYAPHPRLLLDQPLLLVGQVGSGTSAIARSIAARTGVPFADVDRDVESEAGRALAELVGHEGLAALAERSARALDRALSRRPCAVIAGGSAPVAAERAAWARERAGVVYVRRPADALWRRIRAQLEDRPGSLYPFALATPETPEALQPFLDAQEPELARAHVLLDGGDRHVHAIAAELVDALDRIVGTESV